MLYQEYLNLLTFKESKYSTVIKYWHLTRFTWPRALFVSSIYSSLYPLKEAISLQIPSIGIADTNSQSQGAGIPVPGNDDSSSCLIFFNTLFSSFISQRKFSSVSA
jgi:ribosomal protein S2